MVGGDLRAACAAPVLQRLDDCFVEDLALLDELDHAGLEVHLSKCDVLEVVAIFRGAVEIASCEVVEDHPEADAVLGVQDGLAVLP